MAKLREIATLLGLPEPAGAGEVEIEGVAALSDAGPRDLSLVATDAYVPQLLASAAGAVLLQRKIKLPAEWNRPVLVVDDVELAIGRVLPLFAPPTPHPPGGIDPTAIIASSAVIASDAAIGPHVIIGAAARIGKRCVFHAGVYVGENVRIGDDCTLFPHVVLRERITLGNRVTIHAGSVLGTDGFGYRWDGKQHAKIPQIGSVIVEDDVEIGSCVCIDRAKFSATRIGRGTKIDNLVQVGHNVQIGPHCIIVGQVGLAGSCRLGTGVVIGGQCAVRDHVQVGDGAMLAACSAIADDVPAKAIVSGTPAIPHRQSLREQAAFRRLPDLGVQVRKLQEEVDELKRAMKEGGKTQAGGAEGRPD